MLIFVIKQGGIQMNVDLCFNIKLGYYSYLIFLEEGQWSVYYCSGLHKMSLISVCGSLRSAYNMMRLHILGKHQVALTIPELRKEYTIVQSVESMKRI